MFLGLFQSIDSYQLEFWTQGMFTQTRLPNTRPSNGVFNVFLQATPKSCNSVRDADSPCSGHFPPKVIQNGQLCCSSSVFPLLFHWVFLSWPRFFFNEGLYFALLFCLMINYLDLFDKCHTHILKHLPTLLSESPKFIWSPFSFPIPLESSSTILHVFSETCIWLQLKFLSL